MENGNFLFYKGKIRKKKAMGNIITKISRSIWDGGKTIKRMGKVP